MADIPNMIKAIGPAPATTPDSAKSIPLSPFYTNYPITHHRGHPGARIANIACAVIFALLIAALNLWLFIAACVSIGQVNSVAGEGGLAARNALVPVFQYFIYTLCILSAVIAFFICIVQGVLAVPQVSEKVPKTLSTFISVLCSIMTISITTVFFVSFLAEIGVVEGFEIIPKEGTAGALVATHAAIIICYIFFLGAISGVNVMTIIATVVRGVELYDEQNIVSTGKVLRPSQPRGETEFVSPGSQDYSVESSV